MDAAHLRELREACHRVLAELNSDRDDEIAAAIRETCRLVEQRLAELAAA
jgi:hypothetical protein